MVLVLGFGNLLLLTSLLYSFNLEAKGLVTSKTDFYKTYKEYEKVHKSFSKALCRAGDDYRFEKVFRKYQGNGFYVPLKSDSSVDTQTISTGLNHLKKKKSWITQIKFKLLKFKNLRSLDKEIALIEKEVRTLLNLKRKFEEPNLKRIKDKTSLTVSKESQKRIFRLKKRINALIKKIPFFLSYNHPVDHLLLRKRYDNFLDKEDSKSVLRRNSIYFFRKIVQDGAQNPNHTKNDDYLRMALDTLVLELKKEGNFLSEDTRSDIEFVFNILKNMIRRPHYYHVQRIKEWEDRTSRQIDFYSKLLKDKKSQNELSGFKRKATKDLKDFVYGRQSKTYDFWMRQDPLMRAMFVSETILYNEVGPYDSHGNLERKDVMRVVLNRLGEKKYTYLDSNDYLTPYLKHKKDLSLLNKNYPWLNLLFKKGEFSFTYFFIPSTLRLFCPEMTRRGRYLRKENVHLALEVLKEGVGDFKATRYFSRNSMKGRINMALIWKDYNAINERPGVIIPKPRTLSKRYKNGTYQYLYSFRDPKNKLFHVLKMTKNSYVFSPETKNFYNYRNPHHFKYFSPR